MDETVTTNRIPKLSVESDQERSTDKTRRGHDKLLVQLQPDVNVILSASTETVDMHKEFSPD